MIIGCWLIVVVCWCPGHRIPFHHYDDISGYVCPHSAVRSSITTPQVFTHPLITLSPLVLLTHLLSFPCLTLLLLSVSFWNFLAVGNYAGRFYKYAMTDVAGE